jgi:AcrR family transcriptional regulator
MTRPNVSSARLDEIADAFRMYGYEGASMSILSTKTGLGRASLYHHFPGGKNDMAVRALGHVAANARSVVLEQLRGSDSPLVRLQRFATSLATFYKQGQSNCLLGTMALSGGLEACGDQLKSGMHEWMTAIAALLVEAGFTRSEAMRRSEDAVIQIQGGLVVSRCMRSEEPFQRMLRRLPSSLLRPSERKRRGRSSRVGR